MNITPEQLILETDPWIRTTGHNERYKRDCWMTFFGATANTAAASWNRMINNNLYDGAEVRYLLWELLWLRQYNTEKMSRLIAGVDEKTFRGWS